MSEYTAHDHQDKGLTRKGFLKGTALAGAGVSQSGVPAVCHHRKVQPQVVLSFCHRSGSGDDTRVHAGLG
jgi:hypothetical protein